MAKRTASDWMPLKAATDHVMPFVGDVDHALADIARNLRAGKFHGATRLETDPAPVPRKAGFWEGWAFWSAPDRRGSYHAIAEPPDPALVDAQVLVLRVDLMKIWGTARTTAQASDPPGRPGRPPEFDWEKFNLAVFRQIIAGQGVEIPKSPRGLMKPVTQWCEDNFDRQPHRDLVRAHIKKLLKLLNE